MITKDAVGFPVLTDEEINLGSSYVPIAPGRPGNDFHNPATGKFTYSPPGVNVVAGQELLKQLSSASRKALFTRVSTAQANSMGAVAQPDGSIKIVLFKDGRKLGSFGLQPQPTKEATAKPSGAVPAGDLAAQDKILLAARNTELTGQKLRDFIKKQNSNLSDSDITNIYNRIIDQRVTDLIMYVHQNLLSKVNEDKQSKTVRIRTPRGYLRRSFANIDVPTARKILTRLGSLGWSEEILQDKVVKGMPKTLRSELSAPFKGKPSDSQSPDKAK